MDHNKSRKNIIIGLLTAAILIIADQFTKYLAVLKLKDSDAFTIISGVFELRYLENRGAAFGIMQGQKIIFVILTLVVLVLICYCYTRIPGTGRYDLLRIIIILFAAGAVGNFIDRVANSYVVDFFYFSLIDFPIFNVADIYVVVAAIGMMFTMLFYYKEDEYNEIVASLRPGKKSI